MSQEQANPAAEQAPPALTPDQLALKAAVATRVMAYWSRICQPVIDANKEFIRDTPGIPGTVAAIDDVRAASFSEVTTKPFYEITDEAAFLEWADSKGETTWVVRETFVNVILKGRARWDAATDVCVDSATGEVIPGVTRNPGGTHKYVKYTFTAAGEELIDNTLNEVFGNVAAALPMIAPAAAEDGEGNE
ncbi:hypothetical protein AB0H51_27800 [Streptomyces griseoluteus]|uniref:hypothetical protein n=1 Tax=Streptomyces griseoluteus TaxID=29306 RepID=UPI0033ED5E38